jgi:DNA-binding beta-propeller fold protein YncE
MAIPPRIALLSFGLVSLSCASSRGDHPALPSWPYATVAIVSSVPPELVGRPMFNGQWIASDADRGTVLAESSEPRYLLRLSVNDLHRVDFLDLGVGARAENVIFADRGRVALLIGSVGNRSAGISVDARSVLRVDLEQNLLLDTIPLGRNDLARGLALDPQERRLFLLADDGAGNGAVEIIDLYGGRVLFRRPVGDIPVGMRRKGIALDQNGHSLYCLIGGESAHSDFPPAGETPQGPELLILETDSLTVQTRIPMTEGASPIALAFDADRNRAIALEVMGDKSQLLIVDAGFREVRDKVGIRTTATDLVIRGGYAFLPGPDGITVVDLDRAEVAGTVYLRLERTGDMAISPDGTRALVLFQGGIPPGPPGIGVIALDTGSMVDVLQ